MTAIGARLSCRIKHSAETLASHGLISLEPSSLPTPVGLSCAGRLRIFRRKLG